MHPVKVRNVEIGSGIPKICIPIVGITKNEILEAAVACASSADVIEWRADWYEEIEDWDATAKILKELRRILLDVPLLFTFRSLNEGGERHIEIDKYQALNMKVVESGNVDLIDVELFSGEQTVKAIIEVAHKNGVKVVVSNHDFQKTPSKEELLSRLCNMRSLGADVPKIAVMPQNRKDVLTLLVVTEEMTTKYPDTPIITMSMDGTGVISRLCGEVFGSALTFGAYEKASAPGQIKVAELRNILTVLHKSMYPSDTI